MKKAILFIAIIAIVSFGSIFTVTAEKSANISVEEMENVGAIAADSTTGRGCTLDLNQICETSHADYIGYRNN